MRHMIFGESHGPAIGVVLEGVPAGLELDLEAVQRELDRRKPGQDPTATARRESDTVQVLSGVFEGKTTGAPLAMLIPNADQHSQDYEAIRYTPRPGHGDYAGFVKSQGCQDYRGGGHFSGRLTAPLVAAGAVARQLLALRGVRVGAHISSIYGITDASLEDAGALEAVAAKPFPVLDDAKGEEMRQAILEAKNEQDSVGGAIECAVFGLPAGLGAPDFGRNVEGIFAQHLFAVPAVKGVDFGAGVAFSLMRGSEANDPFEVKDGRVVTKTNHAGGVNGGITNGMPVTFEVTNSLGDTASFTADIVIRNQAQGEPRIYLTEYLVYLARGAVFQPMEYLESVTYGAEETVTVDAQVDTSVPGTYRVRYTCAGPTGTEGTAALYVVVE